MERCQSGRMGRSRKPLYGQLYRGFESLSFRNQIKNKYILLHLIEYPVLIFIWRCELYIRKPDHSLLQYNVAKTRVTIKKLSKD